MQVDSLGNQLMEAASLLGVGMVFVFAFLTLLIGGVKAIAAFCERFPGSEPQTPVRASSAVPSTVTKSNDGKVIAAITAAVHQHRSKHR